jgi:hypothetical protein
MKEGKIQGKGCFRRKEKTIYNGNRINFLASEIRYFLGKVLRFGLSKFFRLFVVWGIISIWAFFKIFPSP